MKLYPRTGLLQTAPYWGSLNRFPVFNGLKIEDVDLSGIISANRRKIALVATFIGHIKPGNGT